MQPEDSKSETTVDTDEPSKAAIETEDVPQKWSLLKPIDKEILKMFLPSVANIMLVPLSGAVDLMWVGRMDSSIALAGQSAGMQASQMLNALSTCLHGCLPPLHVQCFCPNDADSL